MSDVVAVDAHGRSAEGDEFNERAAEDIVAAGLMVNQAVVLEFPDGTRRTGNQVLVTPAGVEWLSRNMPVEIRDPKGQA